MAGTHVTIAATDGGRFDSYVAAPVSEKGAGVVIVSTISGVDSDITYYADALAAEGFVASAPDMFWRDADPGPLPWTDDGRKRAFARNDRYDLELGMRDLADVIPNLKKHPRCNGKVAVMGFCFGGPFALLAAARYGTNAGISFHGSHVENHLDEVDSVRCPLSFHYGGPGRGCSDDRDRTYTGGFRPARGCQGLRLPWRGPRLHGDDARPRLYRIGSPPRLGSGA